jgi:hypothetical protein
MKQPLYPRSAGEIEANWIQRGHYYGAAASRGWSVALRDLREGFLESFGVGLVRADLQGEFQLLSCHDEVVGFLQPESVQVKNSP